MDCPRCQQPYIGLIAIKDRKLRLCHRGTACTVTYPTTEARDAALERLTPPRAWIDNGWTKGEHVGRLCL